MRTLSEHEEKNVRSLAEAAIFYVGIPAALLYPLGVLGVGIQMWLDPLFPYSRLDTMWTAVSRKGGPLQESLLLAPLRRQYR